MFRPVQEPRFTPSITRRSALSALAIGLAGAGGTSLAVAQEWPTKPVRIIVPFAPGGGADSSARVLAEVLSPQLGQPVVVENRPGAGSAVGVTVAAQSRDGHTLLMGSNSMVINPILNPGLAYDVARDFDAIGMVSSQPLVLVVPATSAINSVSDLVAAAHAHPGTLSAGNSGNGTLAHLTAELFALQTSISLIGVSYKGESALLPDLIAGRVSLGFLNLPSVIAQIRTGRLRALAVSAGRPVAELPGINTLKALGYPNLEVLGWAALLAPKGLSQAVLGKLEQLLEQALATDAVKRRFASLSVTPFISGRDATQKYMKAEEIRWRQVIKTRGIKVET